MRFDSGFWSNATIAVLGRLDVRFTMAVRCGNSAIAGAIAAIAEASWVPIAYTPDGIAQVAECDYDGRRLVVRRTRLADAAQQAPVSYTHLDVYKRQVKGQLPPEIAHLVADPDAWVARRLS